MSVFAHFAKKGWNVVVALSLMANSFVLTQSVNAHIVQEDDPLQIGVSEMDYGSGWEGLSLPST